MSQEPTIEQMVDALLGGGWAKVRNDLWLSPWGALYRGPHKAWHVWAGTPMCLLPKSVAVGGGSPAGGTRPNLKEPA